MRVMSFRCWISELAGKLDRWRLIIDVTGVWTAAAPAPAWRCQHEFRHQVLSTDPVERIRAQVSKLIIDVPNNQCDVSLGNMKKSWCHNVHSPGRGLSEKGRACNRSGKVPSMTNLGAVALDTVSPRAPRPRVSRPHGFPARAHGTAHRDWCAQSFKGRSNCGPRKPAAVGLRAWRTS